MDESTDTTGAEPVVSAPTLTPIIGIGASAGGLTALELLFEQLPPETGAAFVVIQHLSPDYQSHMSELLGRRTSMPAVQMTQAAKPAPNTVYLLPPGKNVELVGGVLQLRERDDDNELNLPIDKFFRSLARGSGVPQGRQIAVVVLSGTGSDGIVDVNGVGGLVLCQHEDSAQFDGMHLNAIKTGAVHIVGPVPELAESITMFAGGHPSRKWSRILHRRSSATNSIPSTRGLRRPAVSTLGSTNTARSLDAWLVE